MAVSMGKDSFPEMISRKDYSEEWNHALDANSRRYQRSRVGSKEKRMLIWFSALFLSKREKYKVTKYLNLKWRYWRIEYKNNGTLIKAVWVQGRGPLRWFKERS
jgi:hypothetical protein